MKLLNSIRNFLLFNLLIAIILITSLSALGDYYLSQSDVRAHMDALLEQMGLTFAVVVSDNLDNASLNKIENELNSIQNQNRYFFFLNNAKTQSAFLAQGKYYFQLWGDNGKLLLYSTKANDLKLDVAPEGFSDLIVDGEPWRIFKIHDEQKHMNFIVGERYDIRDKLLHRIAQNNFYIMLLMYPISGLLIWIIIGWGFKSLRRITDEVKFRAPSYLEPVDAHAAPIEIKPLVDELNKLFVRLQEAFEREKRFAADAAHELRTPLAALKTQAQVALKTKDAQERHVLLENLILSVDRIVHIVQQLLTLSRLVPEAASVYDTVEINLPKLTAEIIAQLVPLALEKHIEIGLDTPTTPLFIKGNLTGLSILIRNLVDNAIRYTPINGLVKVEIIELAEYFILKVIDTGPGIPEELRQRVFERFYRIIGNTTSGSGLGLAIVQQIAQLHQATVKLRSTEKGTGLQVEVWFPKLN